MGLLTGKALADFNMWVKDYEVGFIEMEPRNAYVMYNDLYEEQQLPIIIEWLDSVGVYLMIGRYGYTINIDDIGSWNRKVSGCRFDITKQAIIHANKIYNER